MDLESKRLDAEVLSFIRKFSSRPASDAAFNRLAVRIFEYQFRRNAAYRRWAESEGKRPGRFRHWKQIPAVPAQAFKRLRLACFPKKREVRVFRTSGTTMSIRGRHFFDTLKLYEAAIVPPFRKHLLSDGVKLRYFFLMSSPAQARDSSLSYMMGVVDRVFGGGKGRFYVRAGRPDFEGLYQDLRREKGRAFLLSTSFALKGFLDFISESKEALRLAEGSRIMETGGFKGHAAEVSKRELYRLCDRFLGIPASRIVSEYGMTELSSQFYDGKPPAWLRTVVLNPRTGREARRGAAGVLRHVDLANRGSVLAVETEDLGQAVRGGVALLGRASRAERRGCSLAFEEFLKK